MRRKSLRNVILSVSLARVQGGLTTLTFMRYDRHVGSEGQTVIFQFGEFAGRTRSPSPTTYPTMRV